MSGLALIVARLKICQILMISYKPKLDKYHLNLYVSFAFIPWVVGFFHLGTMDFSVVSQFTSTGGEEGDVKKKNSSLVSPSLIRLVPVTSEKKIRQIIEKMLI